MLQERLQKDPLSTSHAGGCREAKEAEGRGCEARCILSLFHSFGCRQASMAFLLALEPTQVEAAGTGKFDGKLDSSRRNTADTDVRMAPLRVTGLNRKSIHIEIHPVLQALPCEKCQSPCLLEKGGENSLAPL